MTAAWHLVVTPPSKLMTEDWVLGRGMIKKLESNPPSSLFLLESIANLQRSLALMEPGEGAKIPGWEIDALRVVEEGKSPTLRTRMQGQFIKEDKNMLNRFVPSWG